MSVAPSGLAQGGFLSGLSPQVQDWISALFPGLGFLFGGPIGGALGTGISSIFSAERIREADDRSLARIEEGFSRFGDSPSAGSMIQGAGLPNFSVNGQSLGPGGGGGDIDFGSIFNSFDVFQNIFADAGGFSPITPQTLDPDDFTLAYDSQELRDLAAGIGADLRSGGSNYEGVLDRIEGRFPDINEFESDRLGGVAESARRNLSLGRQSIIGAEGGDLESASGSLARFDFSSAIGAGRSAQEVAAQAEGLRSTQAGIIGNIDAAIANFRAQDALSRDTGAANAALAAALQGDTSALAASTTDIENRIGIETANVDRDATAQDRNNQIRIALSQIAAGFSGADSANIGNAIFQAVGINAGFAEVAAQLGVTMDMLAQQLLSGHVENLPLMDQRMEQLLQPFIMADQFAPEDPGLKFGGAAFGVTVSDPGCVAGWSLVETPGGQRMLRDVKKGDRVMGADGDFHEVVATDYGTVPENRQHEHLLIDIETTDGERRSLWITKRHSIQGREAQLWRPGDKIEVFGQSKQGRVSCVAKTPYVVSGDLMLEGNVPYVVNGIAVDSVIGAIGLEKWNAAIAA